MATGPIDYTFGGQASPFQALMQGAQMGAQFGKLQAQRQAAEQQGLLAITQRQAAEAKAIADQRAAEEARLRTERYNQFVESFLAKPPEQRTMADLEPLTALAPNKDALDRAKELMSSFSAERQGTVKRTYGRLLAALEFDPARAESMINLEIEAQRDPVQKKALQDSLEVLRTVGARAAADTLEITGAAVFGKDWHDSIVAMRKERRDRELQPLIVEAKRRENIPTSILEAINFDKLTPDQQKTFRNLQALKNPPAVTNVPVTVIEKGAAGELGKLVPDLYEQASAAAGQLQDIPRYREAAKRAITGPMAEQRLTLERIKNILGLTGDKALAATSELIQGQAEMALRSRSLMTGQGTITEGEQRLLVRARAGDLNMTGAEFNTLLDVFERAARAQYDKSTRLLRSAATKSDTAKMFLDNVPQLPPAPGAGAPTGAGVTVTLPSGQVATFPNQQAADMFKRAAGIP